MNFVVGLTGGIGSGKTTVAKLFVERGAALVDTDVIAHELTVANGAAIPEIFERFGAEMLTADGALNRVEMRKKVFADAHAKKQLEKIMHPLIRAESDRRCRDLKEAPYIVLAVPLLVELGVYRERVSRVLVVDCDESVQVSRVMSRNSMSEIEVRAIMAKQVSRDERLAAADDVILNDGSFDSLYEQIAALHQRYLHLASEK